MGVASFCVLTVSLLLVGFSTLFIMNVEILMGSIENKNEVVLFLKDDLSADEIAQAGSSIRGIDNISFVEYYSKEDALENYIAQMQGYQDVFETLRDDNPLPNAYKIKIADTSVMGKTVNQLNSFGFTDSVKAPNDFARIITKLKKVVSIISIVLLVALITVSMIIISNSIRASVYARRREINIMKYVGATDSFIRVPFFFEGLFTGFVSGVGASVVTYLGYNALMDVISNDIQFFEQIGVSEPLPFDDVKIIVIAVYLCIGAIIGAIGSVISTTRHLKV